MRMIFRVGKFLKFRVLNVAIHFFLTCNTRWRNLQYMKVARTFRLEESVAQYIEDRSKSLSRAEGKKVSQADVIERDMGENQELREFVEDAEIKLRHYRDDVMCHDSECAYEASLKDSGGDVEVAAEATGIVDRTALGAAALGGDVASMERLKQIAAGETVSVVPSVTPGSSSTGANHCVHCEKNFPRPDGTKPSSRCQPCAVAGHWNADPGVCQKCKENAYYEKQAAGDKVARAAGRDDIVYD